MKKRHVFVFDIVGLAPEHLQSMDDLPNISYLAGLGKWVPMEPVFPGLTLPGQASLVTGLPPREHGIVANGFFYPERLEVSFWDQYASLVQGEPIWRSLKRQNPDLTTAAIFWQNTLYADADVIVTPRPIHLENEMIQWCYSKPVGLYENLSRELGPFNLMHYWGPMASPKSSEWIINASRSVLKENDPDLLLAYLPHIDYSSQRFGPDDPRVREDLRIADRLIGEFLDTVKAAGIEDRSVFVLLSEYSFSAVSAAVPLNLVLRRAGLVKTREIGGKEYLDLEMSKAFAMVDHQIAHIYIRNGGEEAVRKVLEETDGVQFVLNRDEQKKYGTDHGRCGDLIAISRPDRWFSYYWWESPEMAPKFAFTVDIHRKPGYDPLELFFDPRTKSIPMDTSLIKGSHGYPADDGKRMAVFLIGGKGLDDPGIGERIRTVDVKPLIENLLK